MGSKSFIVEAGELIKSGPMPFIVGVLGRSHDNFTDVNKLVELIGLVDSVL